MNNKGKLTKWLYWFLFAVAVILVYKTLDNFSAIGAWIKNLIDVLMPFIVGLLIAYLLYIPCRKVESLYRKTKKLKFIQKRARGLSILTVYLIVIIILAIGINFLMPIIASSIIDLVSNIQGYYNTLMTNIENLPDDSILNNEMVLDVLQSIQNIDLKQYINIDKIAEYAKGVINVAGGIIDFFVAIIVSIYLLLQRREIMEFFKKLPAKIIKGFSLDDKVFAEESARSGSAVVIHYKIDSANNISDQWKDEPLKESVEGLFVREFLLFFGETLSYYCTVTTAEDVYDTPVRKLSIEESDTKGRTRYQLINRMLMQMSLGAKEETEETMKKYMWQEAFADSMFKIIE